MTASLQHAQQAGGWAPLSKRLSTSSAPWSCRPCPGAVVTETLVTKLRSRRAAQSIAAEQRICPHPALCSVLGWQ